MNETTITVSGVVDTFLLLPAIAVQLILDGLHTAGVIACAPLATSSYPLTAAYFAGRFLMTSLCALQLPPPCGLL
jgi:hypothetical protein